MPRGVWNQLITKNIVDSDGEITIEIGTFSPGTIVNFIFGIQAITDIPSLMIFIVNGTTKKTVRLLASATKKKLSNGEVWNSSVEEYSLHG
ncbi:MAG: hypothetical protein EOO88_11525 [Pedobacter sp.]|nr:MAG: hypothetical protein EOO88_11525 [Pedobacter sp.]